MVSMVDHVSSNIKFHNYSRVIVRFAPFRGAYAALLLSREWTGGGETMPAAYDYPPQLWRELTAVSLEEQVNQLLNPGWHFAPPIVAN